MLQVDVRPHADGRAFGYYVEAREDGELVGRLFVLTLGMQEGTVSEIDVRPDRRRRGIATALLAHARTHVGPVTHADDRTALGNLFAASDPAGWPPEQPEPLEEEERDESFWH